MIVIPLQFVFSWVTFRVYKALQGCVDHRTFVQFIPGSQHRLPHSTFHIMTSNYQFISDHMHKLTRTFV